MASTEVEPLVTRLDENGDKASSNLHEARRRPTVSRSCQTSETYFQNNSAKNSSSIGSVSNGLPFPDFTKGPMSDVFMGKIMEDFEKKMNEQLKALDEINKKREEEEKQREKMRLSTHIPKELQDSAMQTEKTWQQLFAMLQEARRHELSEKEHNVLSSPNIHSVIDSPYLFPQPDSECLVLHALSSWISTWPPYQSAAISKLMSQQVCSWIRSAWRLQRPILEDQKPSKKSLSKSNNVSQEKSEGHTHQVHNPMESVVHMHPWQGVVFACRIAMATRYGGWQRLRTEGFQALFSKPPVIYISGASPIDLEDYLAMQLGLSINSVYRVPLARPFDADESMDLIALEQKINADIAAGKTPLLIFAYAGSPICGTVDNVKTLHELAEKHRIWLHMEGVKLNDLVLLGVPTIVNQVDHWVDSATLSVGQWIALPNMPFSTHILRPDTMKELDESGVNTLSELTTKQDRISLLPLWFRLQQWGHDFIVQRVKTTHDIMREMRSIVEELPSLSVLNKHGHKSGESETRSPPQEKANGIMPTVRLVVTSLISIFTTWDTPAPILIFKFVRNREGLPTDPSREVAPYAANRSHRKTVHIQKPSFVSDHMTPKDRYMQALNCWLYKVLSSEFPEFDFRLVKLSGHRKCIRFCALEAASSTDVATMQSSISKFKTSLQMYLRVLDATLQERLEFRATVQARNDMLFLDDPNFPGLGQVVYLPDPCHGRKALDNFNEKELREVSAMNQYIVQEHLLHDKGPKVDGIDIPVFSLMEWNLNNMVFNDEVTPLDCSDMDSIISPQISPFALMSEKNQLYSNINTSVTTSPQSPELDVSQDTEGSLLNASFESNGHVPRTTSMNDPCLSDQLSSLDNVACIGFGLISPGMDVNELLTQVTEAGRKVEEDRMAFMRLESLVKQGIVTATKEISKEQKNKMLQMGMLRQVPYLDTLISWWTPGQSQESIKGLTLDVSRGEIVSTEDTYKYKIQLQNHISTETSKSSHPLSSNPDLQSSDV